MPHIGGRGGGIVCVEVGFDRLLERALGGEDEVDRVATGSLAAGVGSDVVGDCLHLGAGVGGSDREAADPQNREVDDVVADVSELVEGDAGLGDDLFDGRHLVALALVHKLDLEILGADGDRARVALGDQADAETADAGERDAEAVVSGEALELDAVGVRRGGFGQNVDLAVREDAVDVEDDEFDIARAVLCGGHAAMISAARLLPVENPDPLQIAPLRGRNVRRW